MQQSRTTQSSGGEVGPVYVQAHLFSPVAKAAAQLDARPQVQRSFQLSSSGPSKREEAAVLDFAQAISEARGAALLQMQRSTGAANSADVESAALRYTSLLLGLINRQEVTPGAASPAPSGTSPTPDFAEAPAGSSTIPADGPLRTAVTFNWQDVLLTPSQASSAPDAVFELASFLVALALWKMRFAAGLCQTGSAGASTEASTAAYKLLLSAAGHFQYAKDTLVPLLQGSVPSTDCHPQALAAYASLCLADAQSLTVLRAVQKGNQPSLISSLASDTALLYRSAAQTAQGVPYAQSGHKAVAYAQYKATSFQAYAHAFAGQQLAQDGQAGQAVRCYTAAQPLVASTQAGAAAYDRALPATPAQEHKAFDAELSQVVESGFAKVKRENDVIYYQRVPSEIPELQPPRRMVAPTAFVLPAVAPAAMQAGLASMPAPDRSLSPAPPMAPHSTTSPAAVSADPEKGAVANGQAGSQEQEQEGGSCFRWLLVIIAMPFLVILTVVGAVVWIVLLPVKIICCPCGCLIQCMWDLIEYFLKAPFRAIMWASGKPWKPKKPAKVADDS